MTSPYPIDTAATVGEASDSMWLHCPVCSASYPAALSEDAPCPNSDQPDHQDEGGAAMARHTSRTSRTARAAAGRDPERASIAEIAALTRRLRHLRSPDATEAERAAFLADKDALLARCDDPDIDRKD